MNQRAAFRETVQLARDREMPALPGSSVGLDHLQSMWARAEGSFSDAKLGRWLGWAQCAVVASGVASLDEMKAINVKWSADVA